MRRLIRPAARYLAATARDVAEGWDRFWFTPADPTLLGLIRVLTGQASEADLVAVKESEEH